MKAVLSTILRRVIFGLALAFFCAPGLAAAPVYREVFSFTNGWVRAKAFNNARDVLASYYESVQGVEQEVYGIIRTNGNLRLTPVTHPTVQSAAATAISQRRDNGNVFVAGTATCDEGYTRACVWEVAPDGNYVFTLAQIITLPADSQLPGGKESSYATAINQFGVMVGGADSHITSVPTRWAPPYTTAETFRLSFLGGCNFVAIDDNGNMLANSVQFNRGAANEHAAGALIRPDGAVLEIPVLEQRTNLPPGDDGYYYNNEGLAVRGEWVVGRAIVGTSFTAFAWRIGETNAVKLLPGSQTTMAWSVNPSGQVLGSGEAGLSFWQQKDGEFARYYVGEMIPADSFYPTTTVVNEAFLNDAGEIALTFNGTIFTPAPSTLRVYAPVSDGIVHISPYVPNATEDWGTMDFNVRLTRAEGNDGPVTVNYRTVDGTARAGVNYIAQQGSVTWGPGDVDEKYIHVRLIDNVEFDGGKSINLELVSATGAHLSAHPKVRGLIEEPFQYVVPQNSMFMPDEQEVLLLQGVVALQGEAQIVVRLQRLGGSDGDFTLANLAARDVTATNGVDYAFPAGVSVTWEPGDKGTKTIAIPLLTTEPIDSIRVFEVFGDLLVEGSFLGTTVGFGLFIVPRGLTTKPYFASKPTVGNGRMRMETVAPQGARIELLTAPTVDGPWSLVEERTSVDGIIPFEAALHRAEGARFFRVRPKP